MYDKTTDLNILRKSPSRFTWGEILEIHDLYNGKYSIIEYFPNEKPTERHFHVYVDGKDVCSGSESFEGATVLAFAKGHLEVNMARYMAMAAIKLLGIPEDE